MLTNLADISLSNPLVGEENLKDYKIPLSIKEELNEFFGKLGYGFDRYTSYAITDNGNATKAANYAVMPNQYLIYASKIHHFALELFKYFIIFEKVKSNAKKLLGTAEEIEKLISTDPQLERCFETHSDVVLFSKFIDKGDSTFRMGSKRLIADDGKARGSRDCFCSVILKISNLPDVSSTAFGNMVYDLCHSQNLYSSLVNSVKKGYEKKAVNISHKHNHFECLSKPFLLLAGISGTGKTRFVRQQALSSSCNNSLEETYCLVSVRPDWHEPSDLLGYTSRLSGDTNYVTTEVLQFIVKAWQEIAEAGIDLEGRNFSGHETQLKKIRPFCLCLDEMNLAPVEQYFADYLSILETREWNWKNENFVYSSDPLLTSNVIKNLSTDGQKKLCSDLGLSENDELWEKFRSFGIGIPFNLIVAGTVNMDETTHGFSRKVIDRALSFDFGEFFPNNYDEYFKAKSEPITFSYPIWSNAQEPKDLLSTIDSDGAKSIAFLKSVNTVLDNSPFELAFRALNELLLSVVSNQPQTKQDLQAVWDDFLMCKVLPRIEGDASKLASGKNDKTSILDELLNTLNTQLADIITGEIRPDLCRQKLDLNDKTIFIGCRSLAKLMWMKNRLGLGFTSFWP